MERDEWSRVCVSDLIESGVLAVNDGYRVRNTELGPTGIPFVRGGDIGDGWVATAVSDHIRPEFLDRVTCKLVSPGDVAFISKGTVGRVGRVPSGAPPIVFAPQVCYWRVLDTDRMDPVFLFYLMKGRIFQDNLDAVKTHGSMVADYVSLSDQKRFQLPVPPISTQRFIAHILGTLDDKIELNRRMNETLEGMARAIFKSWFVDFDPVRAKANGREPTGMDPATATRFPDSFEDSPLGKIPKGWKVTPLPEAIDFLEGPGLRNWQYRPEGMKFLNIRCIMDGDLDVSKASSIGLDEFQSTYRHFTLAAGDIVISTSGTLGRLAIVRAEHLPVMLNTSIIRMRAKEPFGLVYLWGTLQSNYFQDEMLALASGSVQLNFGPMHLKKMVVLQPTSRVLSAFERVTRPLINKCLQVKAECGILATTRDALLPRLLSGEIRVPEAEKLIEATL